MASKLRPPSALKQPSSIKVPSAIKAPSVSSKNAGKRPLVTSDKQVGVMISFSVHFLLIIYQFVPENWVSVKNVIQYTNKN